MMMMVKNSSLFLALTASFLSLPLANAFSSVLFHEAPTLQRTAPSKINGVDIELPSFDELFSRIQQVSPLARQVIRRKNGLDNVNGAKGFGAVDDRWPENIKWTTVEANPRRVVHQIDKIDNFNGETAPILRFRSSLTGPCVGEYLAEFMTNVEQRRMWDPQIEQVYEIHPIYDLDAANIAMGFGRFGDCVRLGIGYCQTKSAGIITPREQLTMCGIQDFSDGSCIIWGTEMADWHNHLLPPGPRHTRARSHIFCTTLTPTSDNTFDVEYVLQLDIGGKVPTWLTAPIVAETVKNLFATAKVYFAGKDGHLAEFLRRKEEEPDSLVSRHSLLMTP